MSFQDIPCVGLSRLDESQSARLRSKNCSLCNNFRQFKCMMIAALARVTLRKFTPHNFGNPLPLVVVGQVTIQIYAMEGFAQNDHVLLGQPGPLP